MFFSLLSHQRQQSAPRTFLHRSPDPLLPFMALAPRLRALGSCVARTAFNTSAAPAEFAAPAVLRALDSCVARTASNTSTAAEVFWSAAPAVFRGASLTGKSITQLKTHTETRCDTGFKPPGIRPRHTPLTALWTLWCGRVAFESHTVSKEVVYYDDIGSFDSKPADGARRARATPWGTPGSRGRRLRNPLLGR